VYSYPALAFIIKIKDFNFEATYFVMGSLVVTFNSKGFTDFGGTCFVMDSLVVTDFKGICFVMRSLVVTFSPKGLIMAAFSN